MGPSLPAGMKNGFRITPAWAAIFVMLLLFALGAGARGLQTAAVTSEQVERNSEGIKEVRVEQKDQGEDIAYIRASIEGFGDDLKEIKRAVRRRDQ